MKITPFLVLLLGVLPVLARADAIADVVRAQVVIGQVQQIVAKLKQVQSAAGTLNAATGQASAEPTAPSPLTDQSGKYFLPFDEQGHLADWANKALTANIGAAVGAKAGEKVGQMAASKIPFAGGLIAGKAKKKGKELGAIAAVGGPDYIKKTSTLSFATLEDMSLYLHMNCSSNADYVKAFAAAMAIYPDLPKTYENSVKLAYSGH